MIDFCTEKLSLMIFHFSQIYYHQFTLNLHFEHLQTFLPGHLKSSAREALKASDQGSDFESYPRAWNSSTSHWPSLLCRDIYHHP
jgi:hypothetical protein